MSDSAAAYAAKTEAMFTHVQAQQLGIIRQWMISLTIKLLADTPGPGNQEPPDTTYDATGRLRGGWSLSFQETPDVADRYRGGPYDGSEGGIVTASGIADQLREMPLVSAVYLWNDVAYGYIVHEGLGRHAGRRPWVAELAVLYSTPMLDAAREEVVSRGY